MFFWYCEMKDSWTLQRPQDPIFLHMLALCKAACAGLQTSHVKLHKLSPTAKENLTILVSKASAQWLTAAVTAVYTLKGMYSACSSAMPDAMPVPQYYTFLLKSDQVLSQGFGSGIKDF